MTKKIISAPVALYKSELPDIHGKDWEIYHDPERTKLGSGGGASNLLAQSYLKEGTENSFSEWISSNRFILINAGGSSRRLPAYSHPGKINIPVPIFRWSIGQKLNQSLIDFQEKLYNKILKKSPERYRLLIGSGDVLILSEDKFDEIPEADILCLGLWVSKDTASNHGVFITEKNKQHKLSFMLQKPSKEKIESYLQEYYFLMDSGIWLLSEKAIDVLVKKSNLTIDNKTQRIKISEFDLYSGLGSILGESPQLNDKDSENLDVKIYPVNDGEFYHFGTSEDMIKSCEKIQNRTDDQRLIRHQDTKPHPSIFTQNSIVHYNFTPLNKNIWVENSNINKSWTLSQNHILTGIPENNWCLNLKKNTCIDIIPIGDSDYCIRPYSFTDRFDIAEFNKTIWLGKPLKEWCSEKGISESDVNPGLSADILDYKLFPIVSTVKNADKLINWIINTEDNSSTAKALWLESDRLSFNQISSLSDLDRLTIQRNAFQKDSLAKMYSNLKSVFYQLDLLDTSILFRDYNLPIKTNSVDSQSLHRQVSDEMFKSICIDLKGNDGLRNEKRAFEILRENIIATSGQTIAPRRGLYDDQIVWGRSPVRLDLAGGWTDTPPNCIFHGGDVVNMAVNINGQPPLQVFIRSRHDYKIVINSIDLGVKEEINTYTELSNFNKVGSPFSIPKAALLLAGFINSGKENKYRSLEHQLKEIGCGFEITLLSAIPKGSGLGTSSILSATLLGTLSSACSLNWDKQTLCRKTLVLEQMLTTGGGWQDQFGGIYHGIKRIKSEPGIDQKPTINWLPSDIFISPENQKSILLYYTGITRIAKNILAEIVKGMFVNSSKHLDILAEMKKHSADTANAIQSNNYQDLSNMINRSWELNCLLDEGTNPEKIQALVKLIEDYSLGYKLLGAGGGGYILIFCKDHDAALKVRSILNEKPINKKARFVGFSVSAQGFNITRS